ncbi:AI-2E family transporter [Crossiella sp. CA-258035]|uniref:AI-2E family transporter n=1 Tax=Crossiella sp. CA-258035 TaxID=2981138 RepID=UPI0024BC3237|nr:AI-2E family transporter [Crossiella sp. CA-258035]WHT23632.1 AI-2E family transporter [Crossiella sp. CA-258035]
MPRGLVVLLGAAAAVVAVAGIKVLAWLVSPVLLALIIVITISPVHRWLRGRGCRPWAATAALVVLVYGLLLGLVLVLFVSVARLAATLPRYAGQFQELLAGVTGALGRFGVQPEQVRQALHSLDFGKVLGYAGELMRGVGGLTTSLVFLLALLLFLVVEVNGFDQRLAELARDRPHATVALLSFSRRTRRYLVVTTIFGLIIAVLDTIALALLGVPLAVLWGLLSFVTNYIPTLGFIIGVVPPAVLALLDGGWQRMLVVILVYWAVNFVAQSLVQPRYVGNAVGLSAMTTFLALVFWTWVLGPLGALLAIPATLLVTTLLIDVDPRAGWAAALVRAPATARTADRPAR